jgi:threonine dehydrogenase-like Zn-dependent dehydrogenase
MTESATMMMNALQMISPRTFKTVQVPVPGLDDGQPERLLIRTKWVSMCGSDIPFFAGSKRNKKYPFAPGFPIHECVGQVVESTSRQFKPGDMVIAIPDGNLALAEYFIARATTSALLPPDWSSLDTSCLIQPLSTVLNAVDRLGEVAGRTVVVVGLGSIGLFFCWLLKKRGARHVVGIDPSDHRCQFAQQLGADKAYPRRSIEVVHFARQFPGDWEQPDICIEAVGHQMDTLNDCLELIRKRGIVVAFGVPDQEVYAIAYETFFRKNALLMAAVTPEWQEYLEKSRDIFALNREELEPWVTHRLPIREAEMAFGLFERREEGILKAVLDASVW